MSFLVSLLLQISFRPLSTGIDESLQWWGCYSDKSSDGQNIIQFPTVRSIKNGQIYCPEYLFVSSVMSSDKLLLDSLIANLEFSCYLTGKMLYLLLLVSASHMNNIC